MMIFTVSVCAEEVASGACGSDLIWTLDNAETVTISGTGDMTNYKQIGVRDGRPAEPWRALSVNNVVVEQ